MRSMFCYFGRVEMLLLCVLHMEMRAVVEFFFFGVWASLSSLILFGGNESLIRSE